MLKWALMFLAVAVAAALAQVVGVDGVSLIAARVVCLGALAMFVVCVGFGGTSRRT
jgi:uncharacterized membrane protein YtjA (UPF0391 family)